MDEAMRQAARAGQFPMGLVGRRIRVEWDLEVYDEDSLANPLIATVLEVAFYTTGKSGSGWFFLVLTDEGDIENFSARTELLGSAIKINLVS